jgi:hypothetical protein
MTKIPLLAVDLDEKYIKNKYFTVLATLWQQIVLR